MGSLAKYGALAGLGRGISEYAEGKREERLLEEKDQRVADREEARFLRQQKWQAERDEQQFTRLTERDETQEALRRETARLQRESDQAFRREQNELDRLSREAIAQYKARGASATQKRDMMEYLLKGEDIDMSVQQDPAGLDTITVTRFAPSGDTFRAYTHGAGTTHFPQGRDPVELASAFGVTGGQGRGRKGQDAIRTQVLGKIAQAESSLMKAMGTENETAALQLFQEKLGYTPLLWQRTKNAERIIGAFQ